MKVCTTLYSTCHHFYKSNLLQISEKQEFLSQNGLRNYCIFHSRKPMIVINPVVTVRASSSSPSPSLGASSDYSGKFSIFWSSSIDQDRNICVFVVYHHCKKLPKRAINIKFKILTHCWNLYVGKQLVGFVMSFITAFSLFLLYIQFETSCYSIIL